jgi:hydrogenase maturation factor
MCFAIPYKVLKIRQGSALIEGGKIVRLGREIKVKKDEYLRIIGNMAVGSLSKKEGVKIRRLIKSLN